MMNRSTPMRWLSVLLLLSLLATGMVATVSAQEEGTGPDTGTPVATANDFDSEVSIGDDATTELIDEATPTEDATTDPVESTETPTADATDTPTETPTPTEIEGGEDGDVSTGEGSPTPEASATETPTTDASPSPSPSPSPTETPTEVVVAASVGVSVTVYTCSSEYGGGDPAGDGNCAPASGVGVSASADGASIGATTTDGSGIASFDAPEASAVVFTEDQTTLPSGYVPDGNGTASIAAESGGSATIVNIQVQTAGRLQISNGQCPTSGEARTEFVVVGPLAIQAASLGCAPSAGASLTVSGPGGTYSVVTDGSGNWIGTLPIGAYTVSKGNASEVFEVESGSTTLVLVVDYVPGPKGTLNIERFDCAEGAEGTTIVIDGGPTNASCIPSDKSVSVSAADGGAAPLAIDLGEDGASSVDVAAGDYVVTDGPTGASADVTVPEGSAVTASINSTILTGAIAASLYWCSESVSGSVNPSTWGNWANSCTSSGAGTTVSLLDANGSVISTATTGGDGTLSFSSLLPGSYSLSASNGCALFANGADARNGFSLNAGDTVEIAAFGCAEPSNVPEEPVGPGPGTIGGENGSGSENGGSIGTDDGGFGNVPLGNPGYHTRNLTVNPLSNVSTLPATGEGSHGMNNLTLLILLGLATLAAGAALGLSSNRGKRIF